MNKKIASLRRALQSDDVDLAELATIIDEAISEPGTVWGSWALDSGSGPFWATAAEYFRPELKKRMALVFQALVRRASERLENRTGLNELEQSKVWRLCDVIVNSNGVTPPTVELEQLYRLAAKMPWSERENVPELLRYVYKFTEVTQL